jgi:ornithine carbamoyltransferase
VAFRTFGQSNIEEYAQFSSVPVINALTEEEHPCQALADLQTLTEHMGDVEGHSIAFVGDGNNVSASLVVTAASLGMHVRIASPPGYGLPEHIQAEASDRAQASGGSFTTMTAPDEAVRGAEAVYTDVWTSMGQERETERRRLAFEGYQVDRTMLNYAAPGAFVMHDLPAHRGEEITEDAIESPRSIIFDQAENRLWAQAAVVVTLLGLADSVTG